MFNASFANFLAQQSVNYSSSGSAGGDIAVMIILLIELALAVLMIAGMWKIFEKAGEPGWVAIVPIYNLYVMCKIADKPGWWLILFFIPIVGIVIAIILVIALAEKFGKGGGFAVGMIFLPFVFYPMLGFGDATYRGRTEPQGFPVMPSR